MYAILHITITLIIIAKGNKPFATDVYLLQYVVTLKIQDYKTMQNYT